MEKLSWNKQTEEGSVEENWNRIKKYLESTSPTFARSIKIVEHEIDGKICTTVIYPLVTLPNDEKVKF